MKICLSRCAGRLFPMLLALSLAPLCACSLLAQSAPLRDAPASTAPDPIAAWAAGRVLAAQGEAAVAAGFYRVNPGDTLTAIAREFGHEASAIAQWNHLSADGALRAGQIVRVGSPPASSGDQAEASAHTASGSDKRADKSADKSADAASANTADAKARFMWPVSGTVKQAFVAGKTKGITLAAHSGEQIKAAASGRVVYAGGGITAYGGLVIIKHDAHLLSAYGNNRTLLVKEGTPVKKGRRLPKLPLPRTPPAMPSYASKCARTARPSIRSSIFPGAIKTAPGSPN
ncbi:MAG: Membrane proteins related to metalloendopeptidases [uncultured Paraburkholderia sp.]|nr:MAG: Membrane proteins related to metalloendopeptidases [uncultured Paraburkholderia sp.]CAH2929223.1 MAG: Membrane proteins related to metalloendopeptidases [uncultured Paraburkholderia sp.]CAH2930625.1 MAG: Membrane proteins related to metalloendopeptidases [uncultured Paraburkholderia sp.]